MIEVRSKKSKIALQIILLLMTIPYVLPLIQMVPISVVHCCCQFLTFPEVQRVAELHIGSGIHLGFLGIAGIIVHLEQDICSIILMIYVRSVLKDPVVIDGSRIWPPQ